jgi:hypothetical protein
MEEITNSDKRGIKQIRDAHKRRQPRRAFPDSLNKKILSNSTSPEIKPVQRNLPKTLHFLLFPLSGYKIGNFTTKDFLVPIKEITLITAMRMRQLTSKLSSYLGLGEDRSQSIRLRGGERAAIWGKEAGKIPEFLLFGWVLEQLARGNGVTKESVNINKRE